MCGWRDGVRKSKRNDGTERNGGKNGRRNAQEERRNREERRGTERNGEERWEERQEEHRRNGGRTAAERWWNDKIGGNGTLQNQRKYLPRDGKMGMRWWDGYLPTQFMVHDPDDPDTF
jgi:hypothetical protein